MNRALALPVAFILVAAFAAPTHAATDLTISANGGTLYFPGENAVVFYTTTAAGALVNPDTTTVTLYLPNNANSFALTPTTVSTGVFTVNYTLPDTAGPGYYAVVITASYQAGAFTGTTVTGFEVSQGLSDIQSNILTAIGSLSSQVSNIESNILVSISALNSSVSSSQAAVSTALSAMSSTLQNSISASQSATASAISQATTSIQSAVSSAVSSAQSSIISAVNSVPTSVNSSLDNILNYEYYILALTAVVLIIAIVIAVFRRK